MLGMTHDLTRSLVRANTAGLVAFGPVTELAGGTVDRAGASAAFHLLYQHRTSLAAKFGSGGGLATACLGTSTTSPGALRV